MGIIKSFSRKPQLKSKIRGKASINYINWRFFAVGAAIISIFIIGQAYFIMAGNHTLVEPVAATISPLAPVPLPTAIDPNFYAQVNICFIPTAAVYGYDLRIASGFRTIEEQAELYQQGRTTDGEIVTDAPGGKSIHNYGFAVDIVDRWHEYNIDWEKLGRIAAYCGLQEISEDDPPHFEHRGGLTTAEFQDGLRPVSLLLPCAIMSERARDNQPLTQQDLKDCGAPEF